MLAIQGLLGQALASIFKVASELQFLKSLQLVVLGGLEWSNELALTFETGFKNLIVFTFRQIGPMVSTINQDRGDFLQHKLSVVQLDAGWTIVPSEAPQFADFFFSVFNPTTFRSVILLSVAACTTSVEWLSTCPNLVDLSIGLVPTASLSNFSELLPIFPRLCSLQRLIVGFDSGAEEIRLESPVALSDVLAYLPSSLVALKMDQFVFTDYSMIPTRMCPIDDKRQCKYILTLGARPEAERIADAMVVWGEENEGKITWYRDFTPKEEESEEGEDEEKEGGKEEKEEDREIVREGDEEEAEEESVRD